MIEPMETWKPIIGFESHYSVSSEGRIMRTAKGGAAQPGKILAINRDKQGYVRQNLSMNCIQYPRKVHRLVADAFLGGIPTGFTVNHINGVKHDNRVENLEVISRGKNIEHAFRVIKTQSVAGERNPKAVLTNAKVIEMRARLANGATLMELAREFGVSKSTASSIKTNSFWKHVI